MGRLTARTTGDVIAHLHSDDYYLAPDVLTKVGRVFTETGAEWLFGGIENDVEGHLLPLGYPVPRYSYKRLLNYNFIPHQATFVKRSLFERAGLFNEDYRYAMDYDLWLRLGKVAEPVQIDRPLAAFRRHEGSLSTSNRLLGLEEDYLVRMTYAGVLPWQRLRHQARYLIRKRRIRRILRMKPGVGT